MNSKEFISQILTVLKKNGGVGRGKEALLRLSCHHSPSPVEAFGSFIFHSFSGSRSKTHLVQCLVLLFVFACELFKMCFISDY